MSVSIHEGNNGLKSLNINDKTLKKQSIPENNQIIKCMKILGINKIPKGPVLKKQVSGSLKDSLSKEGSDKENIIPNHRRKESIKINRRDIPNRGSLILLNIKEIKRNLKIEKAGKSSNTSKDNIKRDTTDSQNSRKSLLSKDKELLEALSNCNTLESEENVSKMVPNLEKERKFPSLYSSPNIKPPSQIKLKNPQIPEEYLEDIYLNLLTEEKNMITLHSYMKFQEEINEKMRALLVNWIIEVHIKFQLNNETLFLTIYLIDSFLSKKIVTKDQLQLIGAACMLIACKYEEIYAPEIRDFEFISAGSFDKNDLLQCEKEILKAMNFSITVPSSYKFFEILGNFLNYTKKQMIYGKYLIESFLIDYRCCKFLPSQIALSSCFLVTKVLGNHSEKEKLIDIMNQFSYREEVLKECAKDICFLVENIKSTSLTSLINKYSSEEYFGVSEIYLG
jgi:hypothetical protein